MPNILTFSPGSNNSLICVSSANDEGRVCAELFYDGDEWSFDPDSFSRTFTSPELRQLADKLDELNNACGCGSGKRRTLANVPLGYVCPDCRAKKLSKYRVEVLRDPDYEADEPIEPEP